MTTFYSCDVSKPNFKDGCAGLTRLFKNYLLDDNEQPEVAKQFSQLLKKIVHGQSVYLVSVYPSANNTITFDGNRAASKPEVFEQWFKWLDGLTVANPNLRFREFGGGDGWVSGDGHQGYILEARFDIKK